MLDNTCELCNNGVMHTSEQHTATRQPKVGDYVTWTRVYEEHDYQEDLEGIVRVLSVPASEPGGHAATYGRAYTSASQPYAIVEVVVTHEVLMVWIADINEYRQEDD